jgi:hypothetical protein
MRRFVRAPAIVEVAMASDLKRDSEQLNNGPKGKRGERLCRQQIQ